MLDPAIADIHLGHLRHNARLLQQQAHPADLVAVVKADAYGHGAADVVPALQQEGVRWFAVATVPEAIALREQGLEENLLVFAAPLWAWLPHYTTHRLDCTIASRAMAEAAAALKQPLRVHLKVDTGMGRIGVAPEEVEAVVRLLEKAPEIELVGLWTHFATADAPAQLAFAEAQWTRFQQVLRTVGDAFEYKHAANSGGLFNLPQMTRSEGKWLARTGIALYGASVAEDVHGSADLRPVMRFRTQVVHVKTVAAGTPVSYGCRWRAETPRRIATLRAGYADGYPRSLTNKGQVGIGGQLVPVAGTVCMDMTMVDLGEPDGPGAALQPGDEAVLFGEGGPSVQQVAAWAGTIPYEICCRVSKRVARNYLF